MRLQNIFVFTAVSLRRSDEADAAVAMLLAVPRNEVAHPRLRVASIYTEDLDTEQCTQSTQDAGRRT